MAIRHMAMRADVISLMGGSNSNEFLRLCGNVLCGGGHGSVAPNMGDSDKSKAFSFGALLKGTSTGL